MTSIKDRNQVFQAVDIVTDAVESDYAYVADYGPTKLRMHRKIDGAPEYRFEFPGGSALTMLLNVNVGVLKTIANQQLEYDDLIINSVPFGIKDSYYIRVNPPRNYVEYIMITEGSVYWYVENNKVFVHYDDDSGIYNDGLLIEQPVLVDANTDYYYNTQVTKGTVDVGPTTYDALIFTVEQSWLDAAVYPVIIDPSYVIKTKTGANYYLLNSSYNLKQYLRNANGDLIATWQERSPSYAIYSIIADGNDFSSTNSSTQITIASDTNIIDYQAIVRMSDGTLVLAYRKYGAPKKMIVLRSDNNGVSWSQISIPVSSTASGTWNLNGIDMCRDNDDNLWLTAEDNVGSTGVYLWKSTDNGENWTQKGNQTDVWYPCVAYDPTNNYIIWSYGTDNTTNITIHRYSITGDALISSGDEPYTPASIGGASRHIPSALIVNKDGSIRAYVNGLISSAYVPHTIDWVPGSNTHTTTNVKVGGSSWITARQDRAEKRISVQRDNSTQNTCHYQINSSTWTSLSATFTGATGMFNSGIQIYIVPPIDDERASYTQGYLFADYRDYAGSTTDTSADYKLVMIQDLEYYPDLPVEAHDCEEVKTIVGG